MKTVGFTSIIAAAIISLAPFAAYAQTYTVYGNSGNSSSFWCGTYYSNVPCAGNYTYPNNTYTNWYQNNMQYQYQTNQQYFYPSTYTESYYYPQPTYYYPEYTNYTYQYPAYTTYQNEWYNSNEYYYDNYGSYDSGYYY